MKNKDLSVTVITLTFNSSSKIEGCLRSVLGQTYCVDQYLIKDGFSTDDTLTRIQNVTDKVEILQMPDSGIYQALNQAFRCVRSDITVLLHSDDVFSDHDVIYDVVDCFRRTGADVVYGDVEMVNPNTGQTVRYWRSSPFTPTKLRLGWVPPHTGLIMKTSVFLETGDFNEQYEISGDYEYLLRLFSRPDLKLVYLPRLITRMSIGGISTSGFRSTKTKWREDIRAARQISRLPFFVVLAKRLRKLSQFVNYGL